MSISNFLFYVKKEFTKFFKKCFCISFDVVNTENINEEKTCEIEITQVYLDTLQNKGFKKFLLNMT